MARLVVSFLGGLEVRLDGERQSLGSRRTDALFAYLVQTGTVHSREHLAELLWDQGNPTRSAGNLRVLLTNLRHKVGDFVEITRTSVAFRATDEATAEVDSVTFAEQAEAALGQARAGGDNDVLALLRKATSLCKGDFLERLDLPGGPAFDHWLRDERTRIHDLRADALAHLVEAELAVGEFTAAAQHAGLLIRVEPLREESHQLMIRARRASGDDVGALRHFEAFDAMHRKEFGKPAGRATRSLVADLAHHDGVVPLSGAMPRQASGPAALPPREPRRRQPWSRCAARRPELGMIISRYAEAAAGRGNVVTVRGSAGTGKTVLLRQAVNLLVDKDPALVVLGGACDDVARSGEGDLLLEKLLAQRHGDISGGWLDGPMSASVAERVRALKGMDVAPPSHTGSPLAQVSRSVRDLASQHPVLLVLDDFQWAAPATRNLVAELVRGIKAMPLFVLVSARPPGGSPADTAVGSSSWLLDRIGETSGRMLVDLDANEGGGSGLAFVRSLLASEQHRLPDALVQEVMRLGAGHPLITAELVRDLVRRGQVGPDRTGKLVLVGHGTWPELPDRVVLLLEGQLAELPEQLAPLVEAAAAHGPQFDALVVAEACQRPTGEVIKAFGRQLGPRGFGLVEALERGPRSGGPTHRFRHPVMREHLLSRLDPLERQHVLTRVATVRASQAGPTVTTS